MFCAVKNICWKADGAVSLLASAELWPGWLRIFSTDNHLADHNSHVILMYEAYSGECANTFC